MQPLYRYEALVADLQTIQSINDSLISAGFTQFALSTKTIRIKLEKAQKALVRARLRSEREYLRERRLARANWATRRTA